MNRVKFFRLEPDGSVREAVVLVTQSNAAVKHGGRRFRTVAEAEHEFCAEGWTRKKPKPLIGRTHPAVAVLALAVSATILLATLVA